MKSSAFSIAFRLWTEAICGSAVSFLRACPDTPSLPMLPLFTRMEERCLSLPGYVLLVFLVIFQYIVLNFLTVDKIRTRDEIVNAL